MKCKRCTAILGLLKTPYRELKSLCLRCCATLVIVKNCPRCYATQQLIVKRTAFCNDQNGFEFSA